ncbi:MAG TPA: PEP-CTERM sorting domain-containing protein [Thiobacillus sp.]|nr:PEP-CTERM sorting domain-containing protein [Thiobacillus sp.]HQT68983.1 PEP-CTERM sorting domain-containing protein [Thiobacillus sp.]
MTPPSPYPRARKIGALGLTLSALLSPSGKIISSAAAASVLVGGLVTQLPSPASPALKAATVAMAPTRLAHNSASALDIAHIEVEGHLLQVVLAEFPAADSRAVGRGSASASPSLDLSGDGGRGPGAGSSPHFGPRHGSPVLPGPSHGGLPPKASLPDGNPTSPPTNGHIPLLPRTPGEQLNCTPAAVSAPDSESPNALLPGGSPCPTHLAKPVDPIDHKNPNDAGLPTTLPPGDPRNVPQNPSPENVTALPEQAARPSTDTPADQNGPGEAGAPASPPSEVPRNEQPEALPGNPPAQFEPLILAFPSGPDAPISQFILPSALPEVLAEPGASQPPSRTVGLTRAAVPEPSMIYLMLLGLVALVWTGRNRPIPTQRAK